jgi:RHS repeat-associated protein
VSAKRYRYTGKEKDDETGLCYHGARYYAPWLGRWVSADPAGMGDGVNRYGYAMGTPVGARDPTGYAATDDQLVGYGSEEVIVEESRDVDRRPFFETGLGKTVAGVAGLAVGLGLGLALAAIPLSPVLGLALLVGGVATVAAEWDEIKAQAVRLWTGKASAGEYFLAGTVVGGVLAPAARGAGSRISALLRGRGAPVPSAASTTEGAGTVATEVEAEGGGAVAPPAVGTNAELPAGPAPGAEPSAVAQAAEAPTLAGTTEHAALRRAEAGSGNAARQVGDPSRVVRAGRAYIDTECLSA